VSAFSSPVLSIQPGNIFDFAAKTLKHGGKEEAEEPRRIKLLVLMPSGSSVPLRFKDFYWDYFAALGLNAEY